MWIKPTTEEWAKSHDISILPTPPIVENYDEPCAFSARKIATRAVILQGVSAVAAGVDPEPIIEWYHDQKIWDAVSPNEQQFFINPSSFNRDKIIVFQWQIEAEWTLLWVVSKVESLGLPISQCNSRRLVDEIIPALGTDIEPFLQTASIRPPGVILAEDDRHYDLWCL